MKRNNLEKFLDKIAAGETPRGIVVTGTDPAVSELAADCGCDFLWYDMEHSPLGITDVAQHISTLRGSDCAPFIRVGGILPHLTKPVLDLAPAGVIFPMINTPEDARAAVDLCRYPIYGGSRGGALRSNNCYGRVPLEEFLEDARHDPWVILQIEHRDAVDNIDRILSVPGVGSVCIGPFDLSFSYGKPGRYDDPEISGAIDRIRERCAAAKIPCGGFCMGEFWKTRRMSWRAVGEDASLLAGALRSALAADRAGK